MRDLAPCDLAWIERAPVVVRVRAHLEAPPDRVFAAFADAGGWPGWFPLMREARWLDGARGGVGQEREVALRGLGRFRERFLAWDPPHRFAFAVVGSTSPMMRAFGEDYRLSAEGTGTRFDWTMGAEPTGAGKLAAPGLRLVMRRLLRRAARNLDRQLAPQA